MVLSRQAARAARKFADQQSSKIADLPDGTHARAQVTTVTPAGAADGVAALVKVTWRGNEVTVSDYPDSYTPALNHPVLCVLVDGQLSILHRAIGQP